MSNFTTDLITLSEVSLARQQDCKRALRCFTAFFRACMSPPCNKVRIKCSYLDLQWCRELFVHAGCQPTVSGTSQGFVLSSSVCLCLLLCMWSCLWAWPCATWGACQGFRRAPRTISEWDRSGYWPPPLILCPRDLFLCGWAGQLLLLSWPN